MCPDSAQLTLVAGGVSVIAATIAGAVGHGVLQPLLEARGVSPWRLRDSLGSMPLVLLGSAAAAGCVALLLVLLVGECADVLPRGLLAGVGMLVGGLLIKLGLLALRKLV